MRIIRLPHTVGLFLWLVIVPAALFGLGLWQAERASETATQSKEQSQELEATLAEIRKIAATDPMTMLTFQTEAGQQTVSAMVAVSQIEAALKQAQEDLEISSIRRPLTWGTMGGAILAFASGMFGLATAAVSGSRARRSQEQLIASFGRLRVILPFILAALIIGFCAGVVCAAVFEAVSMGLWADFSSGSARLFVLALGLAGLAAYSAFLALRGLKNVFALFTSQPMDISGRRVEEADAPGLFRFVRDLADRQEAVQPDTVIVGLTKGFFVTESEMRLWPEKEIIRGRTLYLPAPYLDLLDEPEVAAIIGHELAHFSGKDTLYSQRFTPIYAGLWRSLTALQSGDGGSFVLYPAAMLGFHALQQFDHAVNHWSRIREFEADRSGARSSSTVGAASALVRTGLIAPALDHVFSLAADGVLAADDSEPALDVVAETSELVRVNGWPDPVSLLEDRQPHPTDTHPPTIQRIQAMGLTVDERLLNLATRAPKPAGLTFACGLFSDWKALCLQLSGDYLEQVRNLRTARRQALEALAAAAPGETILYNNVRPMIWTMAIVAAIFAGFGLMVTVFAAEIGFAHDQSARTLVSGIAAAGVVLCSLYALYLHKSAGQPLLILTPAELRASTLDGPVAWTDIDAHQVHASNRFALRLWLAPSASLPAKKRRALYSKIDRKQRLVTIGAMGIRGMKAAEFSALVSRYHDAAHAQRELSQSAGGGASAAV
ncbi:Zn-dependent protease with chaperone function [Rhizobium sp. BK650]|uniref:M48 family metalloprotease n=1 Tax=Rhizobium sp. BK650 TaxID=2586990 RepID=UPI00160759E8|nr:M48 family metallopeptidase [Rhizobium sp. BK650]MBB3656521.1 Zn-dependent protease with chaperone function [Rhizobium sp. BK650]